jgi:hypothetical protein
MSSKYPLPIYGLTFSLVSTSVPIVFIVFALQYMYALFHSFTQKWHMLHVSFGPNQASMRFSTKVGVIMNFTKKISHYAKSV